MYWNEETEIDDEPEEMIKNNMRCIETFLYQALQRSHSR